MEDKENETLIIFNGEIYNYKLLRSDLENKEKNFFKFRHRGDT